MVPGTCTTCLAPRSRVPPMSTGRVRVRLVRFARGRVSVIFLTKRCPMFQAYHGVTGAQHQTNFNNLAAQGYRMISLSVYGDSGNPLYAAVWVQRGGAAWVAVHGVDSNGYQSFFNNWTAKGYVPVLVAATGTLTN